MKQSWLVPVLFSALALSGCEIVGDIFKAGVWVGVLLVLAVIGIIVWGDCEDDRLKSQAKIFAHTPVNVTRLSAEASAKPTF